MDTPRLRTAGAVCGLAGAIITVGYLASNVRPDLVVRWPYPGGTPDELLNYALDNKMLFYGGAWAQATAALLSIVLFVALIVLAGAQSRIAGLMTIVGAAGMLAVVLTEAAFLIAIPQAAIAGDAAAVSTAFAFTNNVFIWVVALAPTPAVFVGLGVALRCSTVLPSWLAWAAILLGVGFEVAGVAAIFTTVAIGALVILSFGQAAWTAVAAVSLLRRPTALALS